MTNPTGKWGKTGASSLWLPASPLSLLAVSQGPARYPAESPNCKVPLLLLLLINLPLGINKQARCFLNTLL